MKTAPFYPLGLKWIMFNDPSFAQSELVRTSLSHSLFDIMALLFPKWTALLLQIPDPHRHTKVVSITKPEIPASAQQTFIPRLCWISSPTNLWHMENSCCALSCIYFPYMIPSKYPVKININDNGTSGRLKENFALNSDTRGPETPPQPWVWAAGAAKSLGVFPRVGILLHQPRAPRQSEVYPNSRLGKADATQLFPWHIPCPTILRRTVKVMLDWEDEVGGGRQSVR